MKLPITTIILTKNEAEMLPGCLNSIKWSHDIIIIDNNSTDDTVTIAKKADAQIISTTAESFANRRNLALKDIKTDWILYIDADERISPELFSEIKNALAGNNNKVIGFNRHNYFYGRLMTAGDWNHDQVIRLFHKDANLEWYGKVHESPKFIGEPIFLDSPLTHFSHRDTTSGLIKTTEWTKIEAQLLYDSHLPKVSFLTILRKGLMEFWRRGIAKSAYNDGTEGMIEALVQAINKWLIYIQVWEMQRQPKLQTTYKDLDDKLASQWHEFNNQLK